LALCLGLATFGFGMGCTRPPAEVIPTAQRVADVDAASAAALLAENNVIVIDVRTPAEFATGHLSGATNINFHDDDFADRLARLDRDRIYLVHCASGRRSQESLSTFAALDFKSIFHLAGGMKAWRSAGLPVE
jgi:rhodanese-related sulfurtransferase